MLKYLLHCVGTHNIPLLHKGRYLLLGDAVRCLDHFAFHYYVRKYLHFSEQRLQVLQHQNKNDSGSMNGEFLRIWEERSAAYLRW
jgi:hypothetical protein